MEAVFRSLKGVSDVVQGWVAPTTENDTFVEGVLVTYDANHISLHDLIEIHVHTHSATSHHSLRERYRSAVYVTAKRDLARANEAVKALQADFSDPLLTEVCEFAEFKPSDSKMQDYFYADPGKPFCQVRIVPKLKTLLENFNEKVAEERRSIIEEQQTGSMKRPV
ncbi:peptide-methionine (S)-S-oxide reductase [Parasalinivibrio latis]